MLNKSFRVMLISGFLFIAIIAAVALLVVSYCPKKAYINERNELVLETVIGKPRIVPLSNATDYTMTDSLMKNLIRTNGLSFGRYHTGYFKNLKTGQRLYLFLCGKGEKKCFEYEGRIYVVDNITVE